DVQIGLGRRRGADADAFVGQTHPHGAAVGLGVNGDGGDAHLLARPVDAQRDLAPVGDQDLGGHRAQASSTTRASPNSTGWESPRRISATAPSRGAWIGFIVFMASTISRVWPFLTLSPVLMKGSEPGAGGR